MSEPIREHMIGRLGRWLGLKTARRLAREEDGTAAVEFGLVALPFLALVFAIIETALVFFANQVLETAASESARLILTGQAQTQGLTKDTFKAQVCAKVYGLFDCDGGVYVDVQTFNSFGRRQYGQACGRLRQTRHEQIQVLAGRAGDIVVVRLVYQWPVFVSLLGLSNMANNNRLMMATAAFRNEPYQ